MNILKVTGTYNRRYDSPELTMADMLRYDDGEMISWKSLPSGPPNSFEAEVHTNQFTPPKLGNSETGY